jgi:uncharacterized membrane protein YagU involved in acid resistance
MVQMDTRSRNVQAGVVGGLAGGVLFGVMMHAMGMMGMVAMLVGASAYAVGWLVHLVISVILGVGYALVLGPATQSYGRGLGLGAAYGVLAWVVGALVVMPAWLGMSGMIFVVGQDQIMSLIGHVLFGLVLGATYHGVTTRGSDTTVTV